MEPFSELIKAFPSLLDKIFKIAEQDSKKARQRDLNDTQQRSQKLAERFLEPSAMYKLIQGYMRQLPSALQEQLSPDGEVKTGVIYTPHSLRATTATLLLDANVDIRKVQDLLGHRHITTTWIYDKRRRSTSESASHDVPCDCPASLWPWHRRPFGTTIVNMTVTSMWNLSTNKGAEMIWL